MILKKIYCLAGSFYWLKVQRPFLTSGIWFNIEGKWGQDNCWQQDCRTFFSHHLSPKMVSSLRAAPHRSSVYFSVNLHWSVRFSLVIRSHQLTQTTSWLTAELSLLLGRNLKPVTPAAAAAAADLKVQDGHFCAMWENGDVLSLSVRLHFWLIFHPP